MFTRSHNPIINLDFYNSHNGVEISYEMPHSLNRTYIRCRTRCQYISNVNYQNEELYGF